MFMILYLRIYVFTVFTYIFSVVTYLGKYVGNICYVKYVGSVGYVSL